MAPVPAGGLSLGGLGVWHKSLVGKGSTRVLALLEQSWSLGSSAKPCQAASLVAYRQPNSARVSPAVGSGQTVFPAAWCSDGQRRTERATTFCPTTRDPAPSGCFRSMCPELAKLRFVPVGPSFPASF